MSTFETPTTTYEPDDELVPQQARDSFLSKLGATAQSAFDALSVIVTNIISGVQTFSGVKTFSDSPLVPDASTDDQAVNLRQLLILDGIVVKKTGAQTISGVKTFTTSPTIPNAVNIDEPATLGQIVTMVGGLQFKTINIGAWDMLSTPYKSVELGMPFTKVMSISVLIISDTGDTRSITYHTSGATDTGYYVFITSAPTSVLLYGGGLFSNTSFDDAAINRGYVTISYID